MSFDKAVLFSMFRPKVVAVSVEHEGQTLDCFVRELSAEQVFRLQAMQKENKGDNEAFTINMLSQALCDEEGNPVVNATDAKKLKTMQVAAFNKLAQAVAESIGLSTEKKKAEGADSADNDNDLASAEPVGNA